MLLRRTHDISRLEAFSDAVFAFALILLVVSLEVPKSYEQLISPMAFFLMCPAHTLYEMRIKKKRKAFEATLPLEPASASAPP